ncbi:hexosaminidase D [Microcaecilia unicolor]|uniref:beta-N-acetylhexosaminidase n=1 Tax=Microcaecilia unicolor TaxID=1415580 RepID=A0A6P7YTS1_9AMPH|nr:hexosaminidase D-like [Microcaecilia unicolor]XP_030068057.1 hexosaminidase D-like [Microcaecilia unicolor]
MPFARSQKLTVLRILVLFIVVLAILKYVLRDSFQRQMQVKERISNNNGFWGKSGKNSGNPETRQLPPQPTRESKAESQNKAASSEKVQVKDFSNIRMRLVHLDLKGAAPKVSYLEQIFPLLAKLGASGLLIEYEDMFPYKEELEILRSPYAYSEADIEKIQHLAEINHLEVVPLVQTFGHMEFVLKHEKFKHLREVEKYPNSLNPHAVEALPLVKALLSQVIDKHKKSVWLHIGADEVYHLGEGQDSKNWMNSNKGNLGKMYLGHIKEVVTFVKRRYPAMQTLMWDDMLRKLEVEAIKESGIAELTSPVIWIYAPDFNVKDTEKFISKYELSGFKTVWFASAFKGTTGVAQIWTPIGHHLKNHLCWLQVMKAMSKYPGIRFQGITITGWQRYDHYSALCELLPVGIPSLAVSLQTLVNGGYSEEAKKNILLTLGFNSIDIEGNSCEGKGAFAGSEMYRKIEQIHRQLKSKVMEVLHSEGVIGGWFTRYHRKHRFANPHNMEIFGSKMLKAHEEWERLIQDLRTEMAAVYFADTVEEWMEENVNPHMDQLRELVKDYQEIVKLNAKPKARPQQ